MMSLWYHQGGLEEIFNRKPTLQTPWSLKLCDMYQAQMVSWCGMENVGSSGPVTFAGQYIVVAIDNIII